MMQIYQEENVLGFYLRRLLSLFLSHIHLIGYIIKQLKDQLPKFYQCSEKHIPSKLKSQNNFQLSFVQACPKSLLSPPFISLYLYYFLLFPTVHVQIQVDSDDVCPISPFPKSLGVVVKIEKQGSVSYKALNVIVTAFPQIFLGLPLSFLFLIFILFHGTVWSVILNDRPSLLSSALPGRGGVLLWVGPQPNIYIGVGSQVCHPHNIYTK